MKCLVIMLLFLSGFFLVNSSVYAFSEIDFQINKRYVLQSKIISDEQVDSVKSSEAISSGSLYPDLGINNQSLVENSQNKNILPFSDEEPYFTYDFKDFAKEIIMYLKNMVSDSYTKMKNIFVQGFKEVFEKFANYQNSLIKKDDEGKVKVSVAFSGYQNEFVLDFDELSEENLLEKEKKKNLWQIFQDYLRSFFALFSPPKNNLAEV